MRMLPWSKGEDDAPTSARAGGGTVLIRGPPSSSATEAEGMEVLGTRQRLS